MRPLVAHSLCPLPKKEKKTYGLGCGLPSVTSCTSTPTQPCMLQTLQSY